MRTRNRSTWLAIAAATTLLAGVLIFLYARSRAYDEAGYLENVALLLDLKQQGAQWELDVLKSRIGLYKHYDPLARTRMDLGVLLDKLESQTTQQRHDQAAALGAGAAAVRTAVDDRAALIERFKSVNAVLHNSLAFLPVAAADVQQLLEQSRGDAAAQRASARVNHLLLDSLLYTQSTSNERAAEIRSCLDLLEPDQRQLPVQVRTRLELFRSHIGVVLREQPVVDELLGAIAAASPSMRIDQFNEVLEAEQRRAAEQTRRYREYLLVFSTALLGLLLIAAFRLVRSHAVIRRVNQALQGANENLEQRVRERTQELHQAHSELMATARRAGMAEIATNVLHNVGNVLNSVNVSVGLITAGVRDSKVQGLAKAVGLMREHADDLGRYLTGDAKGKLLPGYLEQLSQALLAEQRGVAEELAALARSVDHVKEIIAMQQAHAGSSHLVEPLQVGQLVHDALRMNQEGLMRRRVVVDEQLPPIPELALDRARLLQILVNLIGNAGQALESLTDRERQLRIAVHIEQESILRIEVEDNGVGIAPEHLTRVFAHGFTTKKDGHGFGLHSAVIAAREMGGTLTAHSDGPDTGARFVLELPIKLGEDIQ